MSAQGLSHPIASSNEESYSRYTNYGQHASGHGTIINNYQTPLGDVFSVQQQEHIPRDTIPPKSLLLGRNELLHKIVRHLVVQNQHVALHGPGGIGKSTIAIAVVHDSTIIQAFGDDRFFVRFDGIDSSQLTFHMFFECIAKAIGLKASDKHPDSSVRRYLSDYPNKLLLVFDNAETVLEADDPRIEPAIAELADMAPITILLTTRKSLILNRLETVDVPPLDEEAAYATFAETYGNGPCPDNIKSLISTLEFHPLSIVLLAQVAKQNKWPAERLESAWKGHQTRLLNMGKRKGLSLEVTIELSVDSPSVRARTNANDFLRAFAFLPQGVDEQKLKDMFGEVAEVDLLATELCRLSLMYLDRGRLKMLAPIRLYLGKIGESEPSLLGGVRTYYYSQLEKVVDSKEKVEGGDWIATEDINIERLIAFDLSRLDEDIERSCVACVKFTDLLKRHKLRPTNLSPAVRALPDYEPGILENFRLRFQTSYRKAHPLVSKGMCLQSLASLADGLGQTKEALNLYKEAETLYTRAMDRDMVIGCMREMGDIYAFLGNYFEARELFNKAQSECIRPETKATLNLSLGTVAMFTNQSDGRDRLIEAEKYYKEVDNTDSMKNAIELRGYTEIFSGDYQAARRCFEQIDQNTYTLVALAEVSYKEGNLSKSVELLDNAVEKAEDDQQSSYALCHRAAILSDRGDFARAREEIIEAAKKAALSDGNVNSDVAYCAYVSARNELLAGHLLESRELFVRANAMFEELGDIKFCARCDRALGEIAVLRQEFQEADDRFGKVHGYCQDMHIPAELLYICFSPFSLKGDFEGWERYQEKHRPSS